MNIKKIIKEEIDDFGWVKGSRWEDLLTTINELVDNRKAYNTKRREEYKIWLGETSEEDIQKLRDEILRGGYSGLSSKIVPYSLYITIDHDYSKRKDKVIFGAMGCKKVKTYYKDTEMDMCDVVDGEYKIKPERLEYNKNYFENNDSQEIFI